MEVESESRTLGWFPEVTHRITLESHAYTYTHAHVSTHVPYHNVCNVDHQFVDFQS